MKSQKLVGRNLPKLLVQVTASVLIVGVVAVYGLEQLKPSHAATPTGTFSVTPASGTYQVGNVVSYQSTKIVAQMQSVLYRRI
jgi:hypothetical protein